MIRRPVYSVRVLLLGAMIALALSAVADNSDLLAEIDVRLAHGEVLRGEFTHEKRVAGFDHPLTSRGEFLVWRGHGVLWQTRQPFASTLAITATRLSADSGDSAYQLDAANEPGVREVNALLFAVFAGDLDVLRQRFKLDGALRGAEGWELLMTPSETGLANVISGVRLEGDRHVHRVVLQESNGDSSDIRFENLTGSPAPSAAEAASLAQ